MSPIFFPDLSNERCRLSIIGIVSKKQNTTQSEFSTDAPTMFSDIVNIVTIYPVYINKTV